MENLIMNEINPSTYKISLIFQNGLYLIGEIIIYSNSPSYSYEVNKKSGRPDSNSRISAWKADALPLGDARIKPPYFTRNPPPGQ